MLIFFSSLPNESPRQRFPFAVATRYFPSVPPVRRAASTSRRASRIETERAPVFEEAFDVLVRIDPVDDREVGQVRRDMAWREPEGFGPPEPREDHDGDGQMYHGMRFEHPELLLDLRGGEEDDVPVLFDVAGQRGNRVRAVPVYRLEVTKLQIELEEMMEKLPVVPLVFVETGRLSMNSCKSAGVSSSRNSPLKKASSAGLPQVFLNPSAVATRASPRKRRRIDTLFLTCNAALSDRMCTIYICNARSSGCR